MSEVDYTQYLYKHKVETAIPGATASAMPKHRKSGRLPLVLLVFVLVCGIIFFSIDFFTNGYLVDSISINMRGNTYEYYFVAVDQPVREMAYARSLIVRQGGGSGYILDETNYIVILAVYTDKSEANAVAAKNSNTYVKTLGFTSKDKELYNFLDEAVRNFISYSTKFEKSEIGESDFLAMIMKTRATAIFMKDTYTNEKKTTAVKLLDLLIESMDNFDLTVGIRTDFLSQVRYATACLTVSMTSSAENS